MYRRSEVADLMVITPLSVLNKLREFADSKGLQYSIVDGDPNYHMTGTKFFELEIWKLDDVGSLELDALLHKLDGEFAYGRDSYWFRVV